MAWIDEAAGDLSREGIESAERFVRYQNELRRAMETSYEEGDDAELERQDPEELLEKLEFVARVVRQAFERSDADLEWERAESYPIRLWWGDGSLSVYKYSRLGFRISISITSDFYRELGVEIYWKKGSRSKYRYDVRLHASYRGEITSISDDMRRLFSGTNSPIGLVSRWVWNALGSRRHLLDARRVALGEV